MEMTVEIRIIRAFMAGLLLAGPLHVKAACPIDKRAYEQADPG
jgi:hypothetical protein